MPKTKSGEKISWKEFFVRWKDGIENVPLTNQVKIQIGGTRIILIGICCGIFISCFAFSTLWWLVIILFGALINTLVQYISLKQRYKLLKQFSVPIELKGGKKDEQKSIP